ncbi:MAG: hypothetical protein PHR30_17435 [Gallionellaceae bacterium]|nr:hypothetical protein [Gallionellaceae bacterium]
MARPANALQCSAAEAMAHNQQMSVLSLFSRPMSYANLGPTSYYGASAEIDFFEVPYSEEFALDGPVLAALLSNLAQSDPDAALQLMVPAQALPGATVAQHQADQAFEPIWQSFQDSLVGGGNLPGNLHGNVEAALRAAWRRQALQGFKNLRGGSQQAIALGSNVFMTARRIGARGDIRPGAQIRVVVKNLPVSVVHQLPVPFGPSHGGRVGQLRAHPLDMKKMAAAADAIADARIKSTRFLRGASTRLGGGMLAFGPSAAIDFHASASFQNGRLSFDRKEFLIRSAKSQSGNVVGVASGAAVAAGAVGLGLVSAVGWPIILIGLGAGIVAQTVWGSTGMDAAAEDMARKALK